MWNSQMKIAKASIKFIQTFLYQWREHLFWSYTFEMKQLATLGNLVTPTTPGAILIRYKNWVKMRIADDCHDTNACIDIASKS